LEKLNLMYLDLVRNLPVYLIFFFLNQEGSFCSRIEILIWQWYSVSIFRYHESSSQVRLDCDIM